MNEAENWILFDPSILNEYDALVAGQAGEPLSVELSHIFLTRGRDLAQRLLISIEEKNSRELAFTAHSLKSSADNVGLIRLARLCEKIEKTAQKTMPFESLGMVNEHFSELFSISVEALEAHAKK